MSLPGFTADASVYQRDTHYQLRNAYEGFTEDRKGEVYPSAVFRGCYNLYYDCDLAGFYGVYYRWWQWYVCDNRYCSGGFGLVTER